eukprot:5157901-Amphidinium_carterae.2
MVPLATEFKQDSFMFGQLGWLTVAGIADGHGQETMVYTHRAHANMYCAPFCTLYHIDGVDAFGQSAPGTGYSGKLASTTMSSCFLYVHEVTLLRIFSTVNEVAKSEHCGLALSCLVLCAMRGLAVTGRCGRV